MQLAKHWAKAVASVAARDPRSGTSVPIALWRGSETSEAEAAVLARAAAEHMAQRIRSGEGFPERYSYAGRYLREEVVQEYRSEDGELEAGITRNSYGALVLNTARVLFIDVDLPETQTPTAAAAPGSGLWNLVVQKLLGLLGQTAPSVTQAAVNDESAAQNKRQNWLRSHPDWGMRVYRTHSGLRYLATHALFEPGGADSEAAMDFMGCDPNYKLLCRTQKSFRARLTPKPWRCGMSTPPVRFPWEDEDEKNQVRQWEAEYAKQCLSWATCSLVEVIGNQEVDPVAAAMVKVHDERTKVGTGMGLA